MSATARCRVLMLADTHLGFDEPLRPRVARRRRGPDFFARFDEALAPALRGEVDLIVHGGDLLHRPRLPARIVQRALAPLLRVAERGVPVCVVPGNHERSHIPFPLLARHRNLHVFDTPRTVPLQIGDLRVAVSGFPFARVVHGDALAHLTAATDWHDHRADVRLLLMHQAIEGAIVGVQDFTFRGGRDVIPAAAIPGNFAAVLSGHIHRHQLLERDLHGRPIAAPVCYPGSLERTAFAEREETKGYVLLDFTRHGATGRLAHCQFVPVAARPMHIVELTVIGLGTRDLVRELCARIASLPPDSVVRVDAHGEPAPGAERVLCAAGLRALAPQSMTISLGRARGGSAARRSEVAGQLGAARAAVRREISHAAR